MNHRVIALAIGLAGIGATVQAETLTLDQCIAIALSESPTVKIADLELERVDYSKKEVIGQLLPSIDFGASYNRMIAKQVMYMNTDAFAGLGGALGGGAGAGAGAGAEGEGAEAPQDRSSKGGGNDTGIKVGLDNSYAMGFQASLPLIAPQLWQSLKISDSQILLSAEQARSSRLSMVNQVKSAFYGLLLARDSQRVIKESYDMAAFTHDIYVKKHAAGAASEFDVLRTSVAMKNIEPQLLQADVAIKRARLGLLILMGLDADFDLEPAGQLADYENDTYADAIQAGVGLEGNSDLEQLAINTKILEQSIGVKRAAFYPTLAAAFNYNWTSSSNGSPVKNFRWTPYSMIGLQLSVPIFHGGSRYSALKQSQVQLQEMKWQRETLERSVQMQADLARDNINVNIRQIGSSSESMRQAERAHDIMQKSFNIGAASYLDLRDSELALTQSRLAYFQAIYNYLVAGSELELLLGTAPLEQYKLTD